MKQTWYQKTEFSLSQWSYIYMYVPGIKIWKFYLLLDITILRTYSMKKSASWEANRFSAVKSFPAFYGTRSYITTFPVSVLSQ
jgi:hypothetical protein